MWLGGRTQEDSKSNMYSMYMYTISLHHLAITHTIVVGRMTQVKREHAVRLILNINRMAIHRMADRAPRDKILKLNVGGVFYTTAKSTLTCVYGSYLWKIATGDLYVMRDEKGSLFIDRDGYVFRCVLLHICGIYIASVSPLFMRALNVMILYYFCIYALKWKWTFFFGFNEDVSV